MFLKIGLKTGAIGKFWKACRNISVTEFIVKYVTVFRVVTFFKQSAQPNIIS